MVSCRTIPPFHTSRKAPKIKMFRKKPIWLPCEKWHKEKMLALWVTWNLPEEQPFSPNGPKEERPVAQWTMREPHRAVCLASLWEETFLTNYFSEGAECHKGTFLRCWVPLWTWAFWHFHLHLFKQTRDQHLSVQPPWVGPFTSAL